MHFKLLAVLAANAAAIAVPGEASIDKRTNLITERSSSSIIKARTGSGGCDADNVLRNLRDKRYSSSASAFCSTYIQSTVTNTDYTTAVTTVTETVTPATLTITEYDTETKTRTTATKTITSYTTIPDSRCKRGLEDAYPPWLPTTFPASRVSSACSCFVPTPSAPIQETITLTTGTNSITETETLPTPSVTVHKPTTVYTEVCATETATVGVRCGLKGCGKVLSIIEANVGKYKTAAACKARCLQVPNCASFQFGGLIPHLTVCNLAKVDANKFHSDASQLFPVCKDNKIYDRNCPL